MVDRPSNQILKTFTFCIPDWGRVRAARMQKRFGKCRAANLIELVRSNAPARGAQGAFARRIVWELFHVKHLYDEVEIGLEAIRQASVRLKFLRSFLNSLPRLTVANDHIESLLLRIAV